MRNGLAERAKGDALIFCDGDDTLSLGYVEAMQRAFERESRDDGTPLLLTPAVSYVQGGRARPPKIWPAVPFESGNWLVIGTLIPRDLFFRVGGFIDYGDPPGSNAYEDWSLWARCYKAGAQVIKVPEAVYVAYWDQRSRHRGADHLTRLGWHYEIGSQLFPDHYPSNWMEVNSGKRFRHRLVKRRR